MKLSSAGLKRRNRLVFEAASYYGSRVVVTMGGGYPRDLNPESKPFLQVCQAHMDVYRACAVMHPAAWRRAILATAARDHGTRAGARSSGA
mmetsp:Transcript_22938/g.52982  ORF Transcript_22938/g.52982 Transcript_22938/m.52982 type:complete len:91 (+) Transcript_22938:341-613(+)